MGSEMCIRDSDTTEPQTAAPLSAEEVDGLRRDHQPRAGTLDLGSGRHMACRTCSEQWPCLASRLLATRARSGLDAAIARWDGYNGDTLMSELASSGEAAPVDGPDSLTVHGHMYVHVAACPCPRMQQEVERIYLARGEADDER